MCNPYTLVGRHALVCGGSDGIGRAAALCLAELGASVTVLARHRDKLEAVVPELDARRDGQPGRAGYVVADLDDRDGLERQLRALLEQAPVDVLIHNTGGPRGGPLLQATDDELAIAFGRNVLAGQRMVRLVLPHMMQAGYGRIVTVLSTSAKEPIPNLGVGNTVRAAMAGWAKTLSNELPPGVTINNVLPGFTRTERLEELARATASRTGRTVEEVERAWREQTPEGRIAEPEELGRVIAFLCSPAASFVRGQSLAVDGGRLRST